MIIRMLSPLELAYTCRYSAPLNHLLTFNLHHRHSLAISAPPTTLSCLHPPNPRIFTGNSLIFKMEVRILLSVNSFFIILILYLLLNLSSPREILFYKWLIKVEGFYFYFLSVTICYSFPAAGVVISWTRALNLGMTIVRSGVYCLFLSATIAILMVSWFWNFLLGDSHFPSLIKNFSVRLVAALILCFFNYYFNFFSFYIKLK